jgi:hypothetical protein
MRLFWMLLIVALAAALYLYFSPETARHLKEQLPQPDFTHKTDRLYKWRNETGEWQITDTPPPAGIEYQQLDYRDDVNVLPVPPGITDKP